MLNDFRTRLINLSDKGDVTEEISPGFSAVALSSTLQNVYDILYPPAISRYYRGFLTQNYLNIINAAGLTQDTLLNDARISYALDEFNYFKISRNSNPTTSNDDFSLYLVGNITNNTANNNSFDYITITQQSNNLLLTAFSNTNTKILFQDQAIFFPNPLPIDKGIDNSVSRSLTGYATIKSASPKTQSGILFVKTVGDHVTTGKVNITANTLHTQAGKVNITTPANTGYSNVIPIASTGLSFQIFALSEFKNTSNKQWSFISEAPYFFDFNNTYANLKLNTQKVNNMLAMPGKTNNSKYSNLWVYHYNPAYQLAGLLLAYVDKLSA